MKMTIGRVYRAVRRIHSEGIFIVFFICLLIICPYIYAAPTCPTATGKHKIVFCGPNVTYREWDCISCPHGLGPSVECETVYTKVYKVHCQPCKKGTYSDENGFGQCKPCSTPTPCQNNEVQIGECKSDHNTLRCKCKKGYYRAFTASCMPCSWCCGDKANVPEDECRDLEKKCSYQDAKSCDPPSTNAPALNSTTPISNQTAITVITRSNIHSPNTTTSNESKSPQKSSGNILLIAMICLVSLIALAGIIGICIYFCRKINGNSSGSDSRPEVSSSSLTSNELNSSALLIKENDESGTSEKSRNKTQIFSKDTVVAYKKGEKVPLVTAPGNQGELEDPATETDIGDDATESLAITCMNTSNTGMIDDKENGTGEHLSKEQKLDLPVTELPLKIYSKICTILDVEDPFFKDYRLLAEGLGVSVEEVKTLQKHQTDKLLTQYQPKVRTLIEILTEKFERADVVEIIERWLKD